MRITQEVRFRIHHRVVKCSNRPFLHTRIVLSVAYVVSPSRVARYDNKRDFKQKKLLRHYAILLPGLQRRPG